MYSSKIFDDDDFGLKFSDIFDLIKVIGQGAFGIVVSAYKKDQIHNKQYAVKIIKKSSISEGTHEAFIKEANILASLNHPNIVKFYQVISTEKKIFIVMELIEGGTIKQLMTERQKKGEKFFEQEVISMMKSLLNAVNYFHSNGVVHRDIKPENILIRDKNDLSSIKIIDFGISAHFGKEGHGSLTRKCGTLIYMAPELAFHKLYNKTVDVWACGIILFMLLTNGKHPLYQENEDLKDFLKKLENPNWKFPENFPNLAKSLFLKLVNLEAVGRYTAEEALKHPWFSGGCEEDIPLTGYENFVLFDHEQKLVSIVKALYFLSFLQKQQYSTYMHNTYHTLANNANTLKNIKKDIEYCNLLSMITDRKKQENNQKNALKEKIWWNSKEYFEFIFKNDTNMNNIQKTTLHKFSNSDMQDNKIFKKDEKKYKNHNHGNDENMNVYINTTTNAHFIKRNIRNTSKSAGEQILLKFTKENEESEQKLMLLSPSKKIKSPKKSSPKSILKTSKSSHKLTPISYKKTDLGNTIDHPIKFNIDLQPFETVENNLDKAKTLDEPLVTEKSQNNNNDHEKYDDPALGSDYNNTNQLQRNNTVDNVKTKINSLCTLENINQNNNSIFIPKKISTNHRRFKLHKSNNQHDLGPLYISQPMTERHQSQKTSILAKLNRTPPKFLDGNLEQQSIRSNSYKNLFGSNIFNSSINMTNSQTYNCSMSSLGQKLNENRGQSYKNGDIFSSNQDIKLTKKRSINGFKSPKSKLFEISKCFEGPSSSALENYGTIKENFIKNEIKRNNNNNTALKESNSVINLLTIPKVSLGLQIDLDNMHYDKQQHQQLQLQKNINQKLMRTSGGIGTGSLGRITTGGGGGIGSTKNIAKNQHLNFIIKTFKRQKVT